MDYLRTIKLGYGKGTPNKQACWMTALSSHTGGEWTDRCSCVDPSINTLCIRINDLYGNDDQARTEDILEFGLFEPLGTQDKENEEKRKIFLIDSSIRYWRPLELRARGQIKEAEELEKLCPIVDKKTAVAHDGYDAVTAYDAVAAFVACDACDTCDAYAGAAARRTFIKQHIFPVLRQLIDMGKHGPYEAEPVCGVKKFKELVGCS